jgi:hypothetical protein
VQWPAFQLLIDTRRAFAELMLDCPICGALSTELLELAFRAGMVRCCECGVGQPVTPATLRELAGQANAARERIAELLG